MADIHDTPMANNDNPPHLLDHTCWCKPEVLRQPDSEDLIVHHEATSDRYCIAVGNYASAIGFQAIAIGHHAKAHGYRAVSLGRHIHFHHRGGAIWQTTYRFFCSPRAQRLVVALWFSGKQVPLRSDREETPRKKKE